MTHRSKLAFGKFKNDKSLISILVSGDAAEFSHEACVDKICTGVLGGDRVTGLQPPGGSRKKMEPGII